MDHVRIDVLSKPTDKFSADARPDEPVQQHLGLTIENEFEDEQYSENWTKEGLRTLVKMCTELAGSSDPRTKSAWG